MRRIDFRYSQNSGEFRIKLSQKLEFFEKI